MLDKMIPVILDTRTYLMIMAFLLLSWLPLCLQGAAIGSGGGVGRRRSLDHDRYGPRCVTTRLGNLTHWEVHSFH